ncbi:hypothetical protein WH95_10990 [Kiloniella litopenaei]|uniref:Uncharacterized protein n=1 Tax=Kiloniella litopenaei TaxID=1549748 RepID=A0A0M2R4P8_9PROT|nr:hypothetical protein WH95_10990 [Kiloniella litopenaei]
MRKALYLSRVFKILMGVLVAILKSYPSMFLMCLTMISVFLVVDTTEHSFFSANETLKVLSGSIVEFWYGYLLIGYLFDLLFYISNPYHGHVFESKQYHPYISKLMPTQIRKHMVHIFRTQDDKFLCYRLFSLLNSAFWIPMRLWSFVIAKEFRTRIARLRKEYFDLHK